MRAMTIAFLVFLTASSVALWSADAPPAVDRHDPAVVARAYAAALKGNDPAAAALLVVKDAGVSAFFAMMAAQMKQRPGEDERRGLGEEMLMPLPMPSSEVDVGAGAPGAKDSLVYELHRTFSANSKLVLARQPDGTWLVDVRASLKATAGTQPSMLAAQLDQMASHPMPPAGEAAAVPAQQRPWECINKLQQLASALVAYAEEHDNRLPLAAVWQDAITPYVEGEKAFVCPSFPKEECSYSFNAALSEKPLPADWQTRNEMVLLACTGADVPNAVFTMGDLKKLKGRHGDFNAVAFASGNAQALPVGMTWAEMLDAQKSAGVCQQRMSALVVAARAYAKDHDGRLPAAAAWCDDLERLVKHDLGTNPFTCPDSPKAECCYAINRALAGKQLKELINHRKLVLFAEVGPTTRNAAFDPGQTFPGRHRVEWQPEQMMYFEAHLNGDVQPVPGKQAETAGPKD